MADKLTREELENMRRVQLRTLAVQYGMEQNECSDAASQKLIDYILANQDGNGKKAAKGKAEETKAPAGRGRRGQVEEPEEPEEEDQEGEDQEEDEAPVRGRGRAAAKEEPEEAPARGRGRREQTQTEEPVAATSRGRRGETTAPPAADKDDSMDEVIRRLDALGKMLDEVKKENKDLAKRLFVANGLVQEVMIELKIPEKDIDSVIDGLEEDFDKGKG